MTVVDAHDIPVEPPIVYRAQDGNPGELPHGHPRRPDAPGESPGPDRGARGRFRVGSGYLPGAGCAEGRGRKSTIVMYGSRQLRFLYADEGEAPGGNSGGFLYVSGEFPGDFPGKGSEAWR